MEKNFEVLCSYATTTVAVAVCCGVAWAAARGVRRHCSLSQLFLAWIEATAIVIGFIAVSGKMGWMVQTLGGNTPAEALNNCISATLAYIALFLGFFRWSWKKEPER